MDGCPTRRTARRRKQSVPRWNQPGRIFAADATGYTVRNGDMVFDRALHGLRNTVLLPAGWEVSAVSQSGTIGTYQSRAFVSFINLNGENNYRVTIHARRRGN